MKIEVDMERMERELRTLAGFTSVEPSTEGTAVTRVVFTEDDLRARRWLRGLAEKQGFGVREDAVGNTFFRWEGTEPELAAVATGSHIDAIPHAGMFDGTVGVLGGLEAMRSLQRAGVRPRRSIELVLLTSEEPTRFGIGCLGSRLMVGSLSAEKADGMRDGEGQTLAEVRRGAGFEGELDSVRVAPGRYSAWVELHIEQGPLLERERAAAGSLVGVVTHIAAPAAYRFRIEGFGGHAGALLMPDRRDALCAAAEVILAVERCALESGAIDTVATVGTCGVYPGAVNSVPSRVILDLDLRDTDPKRREAVMGALRRAIAGISEGRGVRMEETLVNADLPATSSHEIVGVVEAVCAELGVTCRRMVSRAYHDTLFLAQVTPVAMIFIPCRGGVSHRPDEFAKAEDIAAGVRVLAGSLARLGSH